MISRVASAVSWAMVKQAAYASTAKSRNYTPPAPEMPVVKEEENGEYKYRSEGNWGKGNELIRWGGNNEDWGGYLPITENRLLDFHNTISGTGHGRPYWEEKRNPYEA